MSAWEKFWRESHLIERVVIWISALALVFFGGWLWRAQNQTPPLPPLFEKAQTPKLAAPSAGAALKAGVGPDKNKSSVTVHVVGAIKTPGVLTLPAGSRVGDAIRAAGGGAKNAAEDALNLAAVLQDGEQIRVPTKAEAAASQNNTASNSSTNSINSDVPASPDSANAQASAARSLTKKLPSRQVNVNAASPGELQTLPGIGPALAARIIAHRARHGRFRSLDDLDAVEGVGPKKLQNLRRFVTFLESLIREPYDEQDKKP